MRNIAVTLITMGLLAPACGGREPPKGVVHPLPEFAQYEPQRAPLLPEEEMPQAVAAQTQGQGTAQKRAMAAPTAAPASVPRAAIVIVGMTRPHEESGFEPVYFAFGSAVLDLADMEQLGKTANWLRSHPDQQVLIEGHTDQVGPSRYNLVLGERRARAVRDYLIQLGVSEDRMDIASMGEEQPVSQGRRDLNRRSEVVPVPEANPR